MEKTKIAPEKVAKILNQWYGMIKRHQKAEAAALKEEIPSLLQHMDEDQDLLIYYNLLDFRYKVMIEEFEETDKVFQSIKDIGEENTNNMIVYYSLFFSGVYEFYKKNYVEAIHFYQLAEVKLRSIPDQIEHAEFHYKLSQAYYQIDQHLISMSHVFKARSIFQESEAYKLRTIQCEMVLGANMYDMYRFSSAEDHYHKALNEAMSGRFKRQVGMIYHNLGLIYDRQKISGLAEEYFKKAIHITEHVESTDGVRTLYMMASMLYRENRTTEAKIWYDRGIKHANLFGEEEYKAKLQVLHTLYVDHNESAIKESLQYLEQKNLWPDTSELTEQIAEYYFKKGYLSQSVEYFKRALKAKNQMMKVTEVIV
ncbi:response regulator aspartate phosphatase [Bacillus changyiensis]|uniref:response regulator aspartate phosphatase n=1 Tax=Bacillus changyiensis TaxID=3004103 RepID=UPI0022E540BD|nr:aspartate phosphatase [Bacillus changyiensis]MDA1477814.1 aspartate phosphatase [Bacillus changyiensis]